MFRLQIITFVMTDSYIFRLEFFYFQIITIEFLIL